MNFTGYLEQKKYSPATVARYNEGVQSFINWLQKENIKPETFIYIEIIQGSTPLQDGAGNPVEHLPGAADS